ncbi:hypothetical protein [Glaciecola sp. MF2-115]|uniref:hypothetical protein n=1 Tax=Glaciecola sp. MF2-115 TaxID=3384827 RepID=UPI0039A1A0FC
MKYLLSSISIFGLLLVAYWLTSESKTDMVDDTNLEVSASEPLSTLSQEKVSLGKIANGEQLPPDVQDASLGSDEDQVILSQVEAQQKLVEMKTKIDVLVQKYEDSLSDPEARARVRQEMEVMIKQYDQFALQVAMEKMRNG